MCMCNNKNVEMICTINKCEKHFPQTVVVLFRFSLFVSFFVFVLARTFFDSLIRGQLPSHAHTRM